MHQDIAVRRKESKLKHMNVRALAIQQNPELLPRPRGKFHWEADVDREIQRQCVHRGDKQRLQEFIAENWEALATEAAEIRGRAMTKEGRGWAPFSNSEWLAWFAANGGEFREEMKTVTKARKVFSHAHSH